MHSDVALSSRLQDNCQSHEGQSQGFIHAQNCSAMQASQSLDVLCQLADCLQIVWPDVAHRSSPCCRRSQVRIHRWQRALFLLATDDGRHPPPFCHFAYGAQITSRHAIGNFCNVLKVLYNASRDHMFCHVTAATLLHKCHTVPLTRKRPAVWIFTPMSRLCRPAASTLLTTLPLPARGARCIPLVTDVWRRASG
jgi:hypothetical protein